MPDFDFEKYMKQLNEQKRLAQEAYETKMQENQAKQAELFHKEMKRISNLPNENQKTELQKLYKRLNDKNAEKLSKKRAAEERSRLALYGTTEIIKPEPVLERPIQPIRTISNPLAKYFGSRKHWENTFFPRSTPGGSARTCRSTKPKNRRTLKSCTTSRKSSTRRHSRT